MKKTSSDPKPESRKHGKPQVTGTSPAARGGKKYKTSQQQQRGGYGRPRVPQGWGVRVSEKILGSKDGSFTEIRNGEKLGEGSRSSNS